MFKKTFMERPIRSPNEGVMPPGRCSVAESFDPGRKFRQSDVRTSGKPKETCSSARGYSNIRSSDKGRKFRHPKVPAEVRTFRKPNLTLFGSGHLDSELKYFKLVENLENKSWRGFLLG
jgi:hypothetical protein